MTASMRKLLQHSVAYLRSLRIMQDSKVSLTFILKMSNSNLSSRSVLRGRVIYYRATESHCSSN
jgi:hypothetical protein